MTVPSFLVVRYRKGHPVEVWEFGDRTSAEGHFARVSGRGCRVILSRVDWWRDVPV